MNFGGGWGGGEAAWCTRPRAIIVIIASLIYFPNVLSADFVRAGTFVAWKALDGRRAATGRHRRRREWRPN